MKTELAPADLERRKQVKLRVRDDLMIEPQKYEGRTYYVVKDPVALRYYRFKEQEHFLIRYMNGRHTLDEAQKEFEKRFRPDRLTLEDLEHFGQQLLTAGLAMNESPKAGKQLFDRRKKRRRSEWIQAFTNILYIKIPIFDPEKLLTRMLPYCRWMFTATFLVFSILVMLAAALLVLTHFQTFQDRLPSFHEFFSFKTVIYLWVALGLVKVIHEFGHGLSCKAFGGEVHEMGMLFLCLSPCMYCNVSDAWTLPNKWKRIIISGAGIYVELMIAAVATFIWWNTPSQPFINNLCLSLMVVCSVSTVVFNGNPLMRYDGYYVLSDWLEIPNLRERANRYIQRLAMDYCLGIEVRPEPYMELWRRVLFISYAVTSYIYRWVITFVIITFMATFLRPYKLEIISNLLALLAVGSMIGWPAYRLGKGIHRRGRLPDMKTVRVSITCAVVSALVLAFFLLPLPVSRVREIGLVQVRPQAIEKVPVLIPGRLEEMRVREGNEVVKGEVLARFSSQELEENRIELQGQYKLHSELARKYESAMHHFSFGADKDFLRKKMHEAEIKLAEVEKMLEALENSFRKLTLLAPRDGVVIGLPSIDELYKTWEAKDLETPFCSIGDPGRLRILVPVYPEDYKTIVDDQARLGRLDVTIRVHGMEGNLWKGHIAHLPNSVDKTIPIGLSNKGGGPLAIKPGASPESLEPQVAVYLVGIDFDNTNNAICPGNLGQVKIHCEYRSCAWWVWRSLSSTFHVPLL
jgi:putative peptide zinc metalloprotease protein